MTTETQTLVDRARLTYTEIAEAWYTGMPNKARDPTVMGESQLAKAMWVVVDWLDENYVDLGLRSVKNPVRDLRYELKSAGIERPK